VLLSPPHRKSAKRYGQVYETTTTQQTDRHENHQRTTLIVLKIFCKIDNQKWRLEPTLKNGVYFEKPYE
jgi:hypothetical protein